MHVHHTLTALVLHCIYYCILVFDEQLLWRAKERCRMVLADYS